MTVAQLQDMAATFAGDAAVLIYLDKRVPVEWIDERPVAIINEYFHPAAEAERDALVFAGAAGCGLYERDGATLGTALPG